MHFKIGDTCANRSRLKKIVLFLKMTTFEVTQLFQGCWCVEVVSQCKYIRILIAIRKLCVKFYDIINQGNN